MRHDQSRREQEFSTAGPNGFATNGFGDNSPGG